MDKNWQDWTRWLAGDYDFVNPVNPVILSKSMVFSSLGRSFLDKMDKNWQDWTRWLAGDYDFVNPVNPVILSKLTDDVQ
jgi:hypothetical protein